MTTEILQEYLQKQTKKKTYCLSKYSPPDVMKLFQRLYKCCKLLVRSLVTSAWISEMFVRSVTISVLKTGKSVVPKDQDGNLLVTWCWARNPFTYVTMWGRTLSCKNYHLHDSAEANLQPYTTLHFYTIWK